MDSLAEMATKISWELTRPNPTNKRAMESICELSTQNYNIEVSICEDCCCTFSNYRECLGLRPKEILIHQR